ncbi:MAG: exo-beta-N-acetylmuramidase NamZ domain-containing protein, partial [Chitinophagaceae bacterium]
MKKIIFFSIVSLCFFISMQVLGQNSIQPGAANTSAYIQLLKGKQVAIFANQTSMVGEKHLVDILLENNVSIKKIFGPEHGFRGVADAGEKVGNYIDTKTGIPVISLYGAKQKPSEDDLKDIDILVFDIQDVGVRFYTFISSLQHFMEAGFSQ